MVVLWLLLYKLCKINNETWNWVCSKFFSLKLVKVFRGHNGSPRISSFWLMYGHTLRGEVIFLLVVFLLLIFSVFGRINIANFLHCLFVEGEKLCQETCKIQYDDKEIQHGLQFINNGASIDGLHLFWFCKLVRMRVNPPGKKQGKHKLYQVKSSFNDGKSLGRVRILFKLRKWR